MPNRPDLRAADVPDSTRWQSVPEAGVPVPVEMLETWPPLECATLREVIEPVLTWERPPDEWSGGRAGWVTSTVSVATWDVRALKFKGLGISPAIQGAAALPQEAPYDRWPGQDPDYHFGFDQNLRFARIIGQPAPLGGMTVPSALKEFAVASRLVSNGVPSVLPMCVAKYSNLSFMAQGVRHPLGVSVTASPVPEVWRASALLDNDSGRHALSTYARRMRMPLPDATQPQLAHQLQVLGSVYQRFGATLRQFSAAGLGRYSGHPDNIVIDERGQAVLVDLDSCLFVDHLNSATRFLHAVRDGMSGLFNLACAFFKQNTLSLGDDVIEAQQPFGAFLDGWAPASRGENGPFGQALARYVTASRCPLRTFSDFLYGGHPESRRLYRYVRHDSDVTYAWLFRVTYLRLADEPESRPPWSTMELDARLLDYLGRPRMATVLELASESPESGT